MQATEYETDFERLDQEYSKLMHAQTKLMIPDLPGGLLDEESPGAIMKFMETMNGIVAEAMGVNAGASRNSATS